MSGSKGVLEQRSLREQVYEHLRVALSEGRLGPGDPIDQRRLEAELGVSRTPLREALLRLELEGFVSILPRRGILVRRLTLDSIRQLYQIIGGLESAALVAAFPRLGEAELEVMRQHNDAMRAALDRDDFDAYYEHNLALHGVPIGLADNPELARMVSVCRQRLYDFPRKAGFIKDWELDSTVEHGDYIELLECGDAESAADFIRDVHWSFEVQESHILRYYSEEIDAERSV